MVVVWYLTLTFLNVTAETASELVCCNLVCNGFVAGFDAEDNDSACQH